MTITIISGDVEITGTLLETYPDGDVRIQANGRQYIGTPI